VAGGGASDRTGGQDHLATRGQQVLGDLAAGLSAAHDQDRAIGYLTRVAVVRGVQLADPAREPSGQCRYPWQVLAAAGDHDGAVAQLPVAGEQAPPMAGHHPGDPHALAHRAGGGEPVQPFDDLAGGEVGAWRLLAKHGVHPPRVVQPQGIPALVAPALANSAPLQNQMLDPELGECGAGRKPGWSGAYHRAIDQRVMRSCVPHAP
jgi:hypothetical protein